MFKVEKLQGDWWAVFIVNKNDEKDRYMLTSPLKGHEAQHFMEEFYRIEATWHSNS